VAFADIFDVSTSGDAFALRENSCPKREPALDAFDDIFDVSTSGEAFALRENNCPNREPADVAFDDILPVSTSGVTFADFSTFVNARLISRSMFFVETANVTQAVPNSGMSHLLSAS
jgi:hypothetical protein